MEKELEEYIKQINAEWKEPKWPGCSLPSASIKEPKPEADLDGYIHRGSKMITPKPR